MASVPTAANKLARIVRIGAAILPGIAEVWHDGRDACGPGVLESANEKQKSAKLVIGTFGRTPMEALHDIDIHPADGIERPCFTPGMPAKDFPRG
jgi:hypothetical protein